MNRAPASAAQLSDAIDRVAFWIRGVDDRTLGESLISIREGIDRLEAVFADGLRRFDRSGEYAADGALSVVAWLRWKCKLSGGAAAERVGIARQLEQLPQTEQAFAQGAVGYQQVAVMARTAEHVGAAAVRKDEAALLRAAQSLDAGQFTSVARKFEHEVDAEAALKEANRAYARRYLEVSQPLNGLVRLDGLLDAEGGATLRTALQALLAPDKDDERTPGQRRADALVELCRQQLDTGTLPQVAGVKPHLTITASAATVAGHAGQPAGDLAWARPIPAETVRRLACDASVAAEAGHSNRTIPPAVRRALAARDKGCVFAGCDRPSQWTDAHHLVHWANGGRTTLDNLALLCRRHHRRVHEEGWRLERCQDGELVAIPPEREVPARARSR